MQPSKIYRVAILEDHPLVAESLSNIISELRDGKTDVRYFDSTEHLADFIDSNHIDLLLLDMAPFGAAIFSLVTKLRCYNVHAKSVIISGFLDAFSIHRAQEVGVDSIISKDIPYSELYQNFKKVLTGDKVIAGEQAEKLSVLSEKTNFSNRETQVFDLIISGKTTHEISKVLGISMNTVKVYKNRIYKKYDTSSVVELVSKHFYSQR